MSGPPSRRGATIHARIAAQAKLSANAPALVTDRETLTYGELLERSRRLARLLLRRGVKVEEPVGVCLERSADLPVALLAVLEAGAAYLPLDPGYPADRIGFMLDDVAARLVITRRGFEGLFAGREDSVLLERLYLEELADELDELGEGGDSAPEADWPERTFPQAMAYLIYTSGSTGRPKGIAIAHQNVTAFFDWAATIYTPEEMRGVFAGTSICFDISIFEIFFTWSIGGTVILGRDALHLPSHPARELVTLIDTVPSAATELVRLKAIPRNVITVNLAGEPLKRALTDQVYATAPWVQKIYNLYGPSEDTTFSSYSLIRREVLEEPTVGYLITGSHGVILDAQGDEVADGEVGELFIGGLGVSRGYFGRPRQTAERYVPDPFCGQPGQRMYKTGDRIRHRGGGELECLGRFDHQVKIRGFRIELGEIEAALSRHPAVEMPLALVREDVPGDPRIVAYFQVREQAAVPGPAELRRHLAEFLPHFMVPSAFVGLAKMPLTPNGKMDRAALYAMAPPASLGEGETPSPTRQLAADEARLLAIFREVLQVPGLGPDDSFFENGGHSLLVIRATARIENELGLACGQGQIFATPTVSRLAAALADSGASTSTAIPHRRREEGSLPLSPSQQGLFYLFLLERQATNYNVAVAMSLHGRLDEAAFARALHNLAQRHASLRCRFVLEDGLPQVVLAEPAALLSGVIDLRAEEDPRAAARRSAEQLAAEPFDLLAEISLRTRLYRLADEEHVFLLVQHHVTTDGLSLEIFFRELAHLYAAELAARPAELAPLPIDIFDYAEWQNSRLAAEAAPRLERWRSRLHGAAQVDLPADRPRPERSAHLGGLWQLPLPEALREGAEALARRQDATFFTLAATSFYAYLAHKTGVTDLTLGALRAGRNHPDTTGLLGYFIHPLPVRVRLDGDPTFLEALQRVRQSQVEAWNDEEIPFHQLAAALAPQRQLSRNPFFDCSFQVRGAYFEADTFAASGLAAEPLVVHHGTSKLDLEVALVERPAGYTLEVEYDRELFDEATVAGFFAEWQRLLAAAVASPGRRLSQLAAGLDAGGAATAAATADAGAAEKAKQAGREERLAPAAGASVEQRLHELWCELLAAEKIDRDAHFFSIGGHSLLAARMIFRISERFGVELPLDAIYQAPTLAAMARLIEEALVGGWQAPSPEPGPPAPAELPPPRPQLATPPSPPPEAPPAAESILSFGQRRLLFLELLQPGSPTYNVGFALELKGKLDVGALERSIEELLRRHRILRTRYLTGADGPSLIIDPPRPFHFEFEELSAVERLPGLSPALSAAKREVDRGFDLEKEPVWRARLLRAGAEEHVFLLTIHHIATDGWSQGTLSRQLVELYEAFSSGQTPAPAPPALEYQDFAIWQEKLIRSDKKAELLAFWRRQLEGLAPAELPLDAVRPREESFRGGTISVPLPTDLMPRVRRFARQHGTSPFVTFLSALFATFEAFCNQDDLAVGTLVSGRDHADFEEIVGFFVNTLVLRAKIDRTLSFGKLAASVHRTFLEAHQHAELPFDLLVEELVPQRDLSRHPLVQVLFQVFERELVPEFPQLASKMLDPDHDHAKVDLSLSVLRHDGGFWLEGDYAADLYRPATIDHFVRSFLVLLDAGLSAPERPVADLPLLDPGQLELWQKLNQTATPSPLGSSLFELWQARAVRHPQRPVLIDGGRSYSYGELAAASDLLARRLWADGVRPGDVVGLCFERSFELVAAMLAVAAVGATYAPLDPLYPAERLAFMIEDTGMKLLLTRAALVGALPIVELLARGGRLLEIESLAAADEAELPALPAICRAAPLVMIYTSGSTGRPKGVLVPQDGIVRLVLHNLYLEIGEDDVLAMASNPSFDAISFEVWGALLNGGRLVVIDGDTLLAPESLRRTIAEQRISVMFLTVALLQQHVRRCPDFFHGLRALLFGGERGDVDTLREAVGNSGATTLFHAYGPTETTTYATMQRLEAVPPDALTLPIGGPIAFTAGYVTDAGGRLLPPGAIGELLLGGQGLAYGYYRRPALTARAFVPHGLAGATGERLYRTGDLVRLLPQGAFEYVGRIDHQVKLRGFRIELGEVESILGQHPGVAETCVLVRTDAGGEKQLVAYFAPKSSPPPTAAELRDFLASSLPPFALPNFFVALSELPLNANGKVDRKKIAALPLDDLAPPVAGERVAPRGPLEEELHRLWCELLRTASAGAQDNFFMSGGNSLLAAQLLARVRDRFAAEVPLRVFFRQPTIAGLATALESAAAKTPGAGPQLTAREGLRRLSFGQRRLFFLYQLEKGSSYYNMPLAFELRGELAVEPLRQAIETALRRHEVLRSRYFAGPDGPQLLIDPPAAFALPCEDLSGLAAAEREKALAERIERELSQPFRLESERPLRAALLRLAADRHVFLLTTHHIVSDGWSQQVLAAELAALYGAYRQNQPDPLPPLALQYSDYANWLEGSLTGPHYGACLDYWKSCLNDLPPGELPADFSRGDSPSLRGALYQLTLEPALTRRLRDFLRRQGDTLFSVLLSAFSATLASFSDRREFAIGTVVAGRPRTELEKLIGFFINTLVLRQNLRGEVTFSELLRRSRDGFLEAEAHEIPFDRLVEELQPPREAGRQPFFQVIFQVVGSSTPPLFEGLEVREIDLHGGTAKFDLTLTVQDCAEDKITFDAEYASDLYRPATIENFFRSLLVLLEAALDQPDLPLAELPLLDAGQAELWRELNGRPSAAPLEASLFALFRQRARQDPQRLALVEGERRTSYGELATLAHRIAASLDREGVRPGEVVGLAFERSRELVASCLAVLEVGATYAPLDPQYPAERLEFMIEDTGMRLLLTRAELASGLPSATLAGRGGRVLTLESLPEGNGGELPEPCRAAPAMVIYTSGSTGRPKGVVVPQQGIIRLVIDNHYLPIGPDDVFANISNPSFDAISFEIWGALLNGAQMAVIDADTLLAPERFRRAIAEHRISVMFITLALFRQYLHHGEQFFAGLRALVFGGERCDAETVRRALAHSGVSTLYHAYGPTEVTTFATVGAVEQVDPRDGGVPIGQPIACTEIYVTDPHGRLLPPGAVGELLLGGEGLAHGYWRRPGSTARSFVPHAFAATPGRRLYRTGDLVRLLPATEAGGPAIEYIGRIDRQIKLRGFRIELGEIEAALAGHPAVATSCVVLARDGRGEPQLAVYFESRTRPAPGAGELRDFLAASLPAYLLPGYFIELEQLPVTANGKLDRRLLEGRPLEADTGREETGAAPRGPLEEAVKRLWCELLQVAEAGVEENFFLGGGHSLLASQLLARVHDHFGVEVPLRTFFVRPTIAGLAAAVASQAPAARPGDTLRPLPGSPRNFSFGQRRLYFLYQLNPESPAYNIPVPLALRGELDVTALERAIGKLLERHEVLRTRYVEGEAGPMLVLDEPSPFHLAVEDLAGLPAEERETTRLARLEQEMQRPFRLEKEPSLRASLLRLGPAEHLLLFTTHHIASDGWSQQILAEELQQLYRAFRHGDKDPLPAPVFQYSDYAAWLEALLQGERYQRLIGHWRERLAGLPPLELPTDFPHPEMPSQQGAIFSLTLPAELSAEVRLFARRRGETLFMVLLAAFASTLARFAGQRDFAIGTVIAGRPRTEFESLVGFFVNTLVLRQNFAGDPSFDEVLGRTRETFLEAQAHQEVPFEKLAVELRPERDTARPPFVQVIFQLIGMDFVPQLEGLETRLIEQHSGTSKFDLTVAASDGGAGEGLFFSVEYNTDVLLPASVERLFASFEALLAAAVENPQLNVWRLPLVAAADLEWLEKQARPLPYDASQTIPGLLARQMAATPERLALIFEEQEITYGELAARVARLARLLRSRGVGNETIVGVCLERSVDLVVALEAVLFAGGAYLPLDPAYPEDRIANMLEDTRALLLITQEALAPRFPGRELLVLEELGPELAAQSPELPAPPPGMDPEQLAYLIYTSGSTGRPKGVAITHHNAVAFFAWADTEFSDEEMAGVSATVSVCFDVSIFEIFYPMTRGGTVILATNVLHVMSLPARERIKILTTVPSAITELVRLGGIPASVISIGLPGEPLKHSLVQQIFASCQAKVAYNFYGPSEDTTYSTWARLYRDDVAEPPIGWPIANSRGYVVDAGGELLPVGLAGELYLGGDGVSRGYLRRPRITAERYLPDPFSGRPGARLYRTGDRTRWREDGQLLCFGRFDHQVKLRGFRIELGEIEAVLSRHPAIGLTLAMVREDVPGDQRLTAYYTCRGASPAADELRDYLRRHLPHFMVPSFLVELAEMPLNPNGKTDRAKLPPPPALVETTAAVATSVAPTASAPATPNLASLLAAPDDIEDFLAAQWREVLHLGELGRDDNFFDLGGHSLLMAQLLTRLRGRFSELRLLDLFRFPTIAKLAEHLRGGPLAATVSAPAKATAPAAAPAAATGSRDSRDIALIGLAGRFPQAADVEAMWQNVLAGAEAIVTLGDEQLLAGGVEASTLAHPDYVKRAGVLDGIENFDADFFAMNAREAQITDPQHRLFLEKAWEALENAGYAGEGQDLGSGGPVGVFAGTSQSGYFLHHVLAHPELFAELGGLPLHLGADKDFLPTRVAYKLDLTGPAYAVQTACSTSLVAVHLACRSLLDGECDLALAGGVTVQIPHHTGYEYLSGGILSPDGHCRAFDARAAGTIPSSGVGVVVLKRLHDAVAAGDHIVAVIRGSAINNDGAAKVGFTAPSVEGQARVIAEALRRAGVAARSMAYVECHGTGTQLGDPIEVAALEKVHRAESADRGYCAISSFKTQVGHMDSAAGVGGLIRAALAVERKTIPPNLHFESANAELRLDQSPFYVPATARPWPAGEGPRRAGVSSFGIGGTNVHLVLEEAPPAPITSAGRPVQLLLLSARSAGALATLADKLALHLEKNPAQQSPERLADIAATLHRGRRHFPHRLALVARDGGEALAQLRDPARPWRGEAAAAATPKVAFLFPGQGAQYAGMARELYQHEPLFRQEIDACAAVLEPHLGLDLRSLLLAGGEAHEAAYQAAQERLQATALAQPALFTVEWALANLWLSWGVVPSEMIGHSIGEYVAATLAGVFSRDAALALVAARGRRMQELPAGAMLAVRLPEAAVYGKLIAAGLAEELAIAAINGASDVVVSGPLPAIEAFAALLAKSGGESRQLKTSHAFHSPMMAPMLAAFRDDVEKAAPQPPRRAFVSNLTGAPIDPELATSPDYWVRHLRHAVRFADGLGHLLSDPRQILLEVGPGRTLTTLARRAAGPERTILASLPHPQDERRDYEILLESAARLYVRGVNLAGHAFYAGQERRRLPLPTTPFESRRFWLEAPAPAARPAARALGEELAASPPAVALAAVEKADLVPAPVPAAIAEPALDPVAGQIEELWRNLLGAAEPIAADLDFYEAGGDSLMATQLANRLRKLFDVAVRGNELMADALTIGAQAALVRERLAEKSP